MEVREIAVGGFHFLALYSNGDCYAWGSNQFGQVGGWDEGGQAPACLHP